MKNFKIFLVNFLILFTLFISVEYISYKKLCRIYNDNISKFKLFTNYASNKSFYIFINNKYGNPTCKFRFKNFKKESKASLLVTGCSIAYGANMEAQTRCLDDYQTVSYKLSNELNTNVYNRAVPGGGLSELLYLSRNRKFHESIEIPPEYILYFYQYDHVRRLFMRCTGANRYQPVLFYKNRNGNLVEKKFTFWENLYFHDLIFSKFMLPELKNNKYLYFIAKNTLKLYMDNVNKEFKKKYPDAKFIIVKLSDIYDFEDEVFSGYKVINIPKMTGIDILKNDKVNNIYYADKLYHPNELYWDTVMPAIIEGIKNKTP